MSSNRTRRILREAAKCGASPTNVENLDTDSFPSEGIVNKPETSKSPSSEMNGNVWHRREGETQTYLFNYLDEKDVENVLQKMKSEFGQRYKVDDISVIDVPSPFDDSDIDENYSPGDEDANMDPSSNDDNNMHPKTKKKKIISNPSVWKRNIKKKKVNTGKEYLSAGGIFRRGKRLQQGCTEKCRLKCSQKINNENRLKIFTSYYEECGEKNIQRNFINSCISPTKARKYRNAKPDSTRSLNYSYHFKIEDEKIKVCKLFFKNTLDISNTAISTAIAKRNEIGMVSKDARGSHDNHKRIDESLRQGVIDHINSFARIESHYCRKDNQREFIDGGLTLAEMYRLYVEKCRLEGGPVVKNSMYSHIFNTCFNIGFFQPKKDQCSLCDEYLRASDKTILQTKYDSHQLEKELSRKEKSKDIALATSAKDTHSLFVFDLQAVIPLPCGNVSSFYYKSKLNCINFTVFDLTTKTGISYLWHEGEARRGSNEISTCVHNLLINNCIGKNVTFYSDNCGGQNKNKYIAIMYSYAVKNYDIKSITHKFLIAGHSQNEGDSMHSCIESSKKRALLSGPLYTPQQVEMVIKLAKKTGKPYSVNNIKYSDILDWKSFSANFRPFIKNTDGEKVFWANIKVLRVTKEDPNSIYYKDTFNTESFKKIMISQKNNEGDNRPNAAYIDRPKISFKKHTDLLSLLKHIPVEHHDFFKSLKAFKKGQKVEHEESE